MHFSLERETCRILAVPPSVPSFPIIQTPNRPGRHPSRLGPPDLNQQPPLPSRARTGVCGQVPTGRAEMTTTTAGWSTTDRKIPCIVQCTRTSRPCRSEMASRGGRDGLSCHPLFRPPHHPNSAVAPKPSLTRIAVRLEPSGCPFSAYAATISDQSAAWDICPLGETKQQDVLGAVDLGSRPDGQPRQSSPMQQQSLPSELTGTERRLLNALPRRGCGVRGHVRRISIILWPKLPP